MILSQGLTIAVDFDGTCVRHEYPQVGTDIGAAPVLERLVADGHRLILLTMRGGVYLQDAVRWFWERDIPLYAVNDNPLQHKWTDSRKVFANLYIDDSALGAPLIRHSDGDYLDWEAVEKLLYPATETT